jgi:hypothetical protein
VGWIGLAVISLIVLGYFFGMDNYWRNRINKGLEARARSFLDWFIEDQDDFKKSHGRYGTFGDIVEPQTGHHVYDPENCIQKYDIEWEASESSYQIRIFPEDEYPGKLLIFGINEDGVIRVYNERRGDDINDVSTWREWIK